MQNLQWFPPDFPSSDPAPNENEQDSGSRDTPIATSHRVNLSDMKNMKPSCMHSLIVPVWIHHRRDIRKKLLTYALLDEQSDTCFVKEDLLERLDVNGHEVELKLSTVLQVLFMCLHLRHPRQSAFAFMKSLLSAAGFFRNCLHTSKS